MPVARKFGLLNTGCSCISEVQLLQVAEVLWICIHKALQGSAYWDGLLLSAKYLQLKGKQWDSDCWKCMLAHQCFKQAVGSAANEPSFFHLKVNEIKLKKCWIESIRWQWSTVSVCNVKCTLNSQGRGCRWCHVCDAFECQMRQLHLKGIKPKIWAAVSAYQLCQAKSSVKVAAGRKTDNKQRWNAFHLCFWTGCFSPSLISPLPPEKQHWQPHSYCGYEETQIKSRSELAGLMLLNLFCNAQSRAFSKSCGCHFLLQPSMKQQKWFPGVPEAFATQLWEQLSCCAILVSFKKLRLPKSKGFWKSYCHFCPHPVPGDTMSSVLRLGARVGTAEGKLPFPKGNLTLFP